MDLKEKVVIVTGAGSGVGRALALEFGRNGARVVAAARRQDRIQETVELIEAEGGTALAVEDLDQDGNVDIVAGASGLGDLYWWENVSETSVPDKAAAPIEETFLLYSNYPNPFNPTTTIRYRLERGSKVSLRIYNVYGNLVRCLVNETRMQEGTYFVLWDGKNETGSSVNSGCYFYRLQTDDSFETRKMLLLY